MFSNLLAYMDIHGLNFGLIFWSGLGIVAGIIIFFNGFENLKLKRLIENIPTSKIRSLPMGLAEVCGRAVKTYDMATPFSNIPCVFFQYLVERLKKSGKNSHWVTVKRYSSPFPFKLEDETGDILINPPGAKIELKSTNRYSNEWFKSLPAQAKNFMEMNEIDYKGFLGFKYTMRLTEYFIAPGSLVYVLGEARHTGEKLENDPDYISKIKRKKEITLKTLKKLKHSPLLMKKYDLNKDGNIDDFEWEKAREDVVRWVDHNISKEDLEQTQKIEVEIGKGKEEQPFFISDRCEKEICSRMFWSSSGYIFGGAVLTIASSGVLLFHLFGSF